MLHQIKYLFWVLLLLISLPTLASYQPLKNYGENPGELTASYLSPSKQAKSLVVLLHGCVQEGQALAQQSGFVALAKQHNFTLLVPQQSKNNNVKSCFNWFSEQDSAKDQGEVLSIKNMIDTLNAQSSFKHIYIVGLSAGGAMASAMLIHYPEVFSAGAVISGLPYPCANDLAKAISCMRNGPSQTALELANIAKLNNTAVQQWPRLVVITGSRDNVVNPKNSQHLALQWSQLSEKNLLLSKSSAADYQITLWQDDEDKTQVKLIEVNEIGHGLTVNSAFESRDVSAPFLYESSLDSANEIVSFWLSNQETQ